ncbi:MAG TPA: hypothetical protein DEP72_03780 [Clostridiales bacterium]|nr:MAG: hypothetical protein A2Y18_05290 [Clostridiales bacterium GWD2_32_19]HCC07274.1 hypothetical protein [Clostridiales bacterium]
MIKILLIWVIVSIAIDYVYMATLLNTMSRGIWKTNPPSVEFLESRIENKYNEHPIWIVKLCEYELRFAKLREFMEKVKSKIFKKGNER